MLWRLRVTTAATLPPTGARPLLIDKKASCAAESRFRSSCAKTPPRVLGDGFGDRVVEAEVQSMELVRRDRRVGLFGQLRDGLADVAVVVDHLRDRVSALVERGPVHCGALLDRRVRRRGTLAKLLDELAEEERHSCFELVRRRPRSQPLRHLRARSRDQVRAIRGDELEEHWFNILLRGAGDCAAKLDDDLLLQAKRQALCERAGNSRMAITGAK
jgi:hypothetical protein